MKPKDFLKKRKELSKALSEGNIPEQGSYVKLFNNDYKILTKADAQICILEDIKGTKVPYERKALMKLLTKSYIAKAEPGAGGAAKPKFAVGEVHNGRKKIVSAKSGKTMWVDVGQGHSFPEHDSSQKDTHMGGEQLVSFFDSVGDKIHPGDKLKIGRQLDQIMELKHQMANLKEVNGHEKSNKEVSEKTTREKIHSLQEKYASKFKELKATLIESATKQKREGVVNARK